MEFHHPQQPPQSRLDTSLSHRLKLACQELGGEVHCLPFSPATRLDFSAIRMAGHVSTETTLRPKIGSVEHINSNKDNPTMKSSNSIGRSVIITKYVHKWSNKMALVGKQTRTDAFWEPAAHSLMLYRQSNVCDINGCIDPFKAFPSDPIYMISSADITWVGTELY